MDLIDEDKFKAADKLKPTKRIMGDNHKAVSEDEFQKMMDDLSNPIVAQKELAVKVKIFLDERVKTEMEKKGSLSDSTRRWMESFNSMLEKLQKAIHGDKSVNVNLTKISHQDIANKIRELE